MYRKLRNIYEEEAIFRGDVFSNIYKEKKLKRIDRIPFWACYLLKVKQLWLEYTLSKYAGEKLIALDAGCGGGYLSKIYSKKDCRIYGLDISLNYLKIAVSRDNFYSFIQGDILNLPFKDKSLDIVICSEVLEHIPNPKVALAEIKRVTKRLFISTVPVLPRILDYLRVKIQGDKRFIPGKGHLRYFQVRSYLDCLKEEGFKIKIVQNIGFLWWVFSWPFFFFKGHRDWRLIFKIDSLFSNIKMFRTLVLDVGVVAEP